MSRGKRRLDKIQISLTPKQAVLLWMEEAHAYNTMTEYCLSLNPGPDSTWPMAGLPDKISRVYEGGNASSLRHHSWHHPHE